MSATNHAQKIKQDSKDYLTTALFQLLQTKCLNEIKITDLVKRAGVSRMAFYRNYETIDEVLIEYFEPKIQSLFDAVILEVPTRQKLQELEHFFNEFSSELTLAVKREYEFIIQRIFNKHMTKFYFDEAPRRWPLIKENELVYWTHFMSAGIYAIWKEWFLDMDRSTLVEVHDLINKFQNGTALLLLADKKTEK